MLKLSALQPHLTAAEALHQQAAWAKGSRATREGPQSLRNPNKHVRTQDWHDQGQDLTQTQQPKRQLSVCIQLEVKLAEALDRCDSLSPPQADDDGQVLPNKLRTAVCCKVLTDLCDVSGPWSKVLRTLRDELVRSVYSNYYAMEQQGLQFSQLPYYKAAEHLEADNKHLLRDKEAFKKVLLRRQEEVSIIEGQVSQLKGLVQQQDALNVNLQQRVQTSGEAESRAKVEAAAAKDELKRLRKEMLRLKNEWTTLKALYESAKVREQQAQEANEHQVADLKQAVKAAQEEAADLQIRLATVVPRDKLTAAEQRIKDLEKMVQQARRESVKADDLVRSLTPRPNWHKLDAFAVPPTDSAPHTTRPQAPSQTKAHGPGPATSSPAPPVSQAGGTHQQRGGAALSASTRHLVDRLAAERKQALLRIAELEPLQEQLQQAHRLLEPEAGPTCMQLQLVEPSVPQSLTPAVDSQAPLVTQASSAVPIAATSVASSPARSVAPSPALHVVKATSTSTAAKAAASNGPSSSSPSSSSAAGSEPGGAAGATAVVGLGWGNSVPRFLRWDAPVVLQPYTLEGLYSTLQDIWAGKAAFDGQRQALCPLQDFLWTYFRAAHGEQQALVAQAGYSFLYALEQQQHHLATAAVFLRIIEGRWQEAHWRDCRHMLDAVAVVLEALSTAQPEGVHSLVPVVDIHLVLQHLFPLKSEADVSAAIKAVSSDRQITISALMPVYRSVGHWASSGKVPSNFVEALQRQYMLDVDNRIAGLQRMLTSDLSKSLPGAIAKHRVMKWDSSLNEEQVTGVMCDLSVIKEGEQPGSLPADVDVQQLLLVASTMLPWCCLHAYYELDSTLLFVKQIHETDSGVHSTGGLPEVA